MTVASEWFLSPAQNVQRRSVKTSSNQQEESVSANTTDRTSSARNIDMEWHKPYVALRWFARRPCNGVIAAPCATLSRHARQANGEMPLFSTAQADAAATMESHTEKLLVTPSRVEQHIYRGLAAEEKANAVEDCSSIVRQLPNDDSLPAATNLPEAGHIDVNYRTSKGSSQSTLINASDWRSQSQSAAVSSCPTLSALAALDTSTAPQSTLHHRSVSLNDPLIQLTPQASSSWAVMPPLYVGPTKAMQLGRTSFGGLQSVKALTRLHSQHSNSTLARTSKSASSSPQRLSLNGISVLDQFKRIASTSNSPTSTSPTAIIPSAMTSLTGSSSDSSSLSGPAIISDGESGG